MRSRGWRQGRGRRAETVYLKPKKKVPAPAPPLESPARPPPTFPQVRLHSCPSGSPRRGHRPAGLAPSDWLQAVASSPASRRGIVWPGCRPPATWKPTQRPSAFKLCWGLWSGSRKPPAALSWQFQELEGSEGGAQGEEGSRPEVPWSEQRLTGLVRHWTSVIGIKQTPGWKVDRPRASQLIGYMALNGQLKPLCTSLSSSLGWSADLST